MRVLACGGRLGAGAKLFQRYSVLLLFLALVVFGGMRSALAGDDTWSIVETKGDVQVLRAGFQPVALTEGIVLRPGDRIVTTGNGRAIITRGQDTIIVAPDSEIGLPALKRPGWGTRIIQEIGTIFLKVESSAERRFEVETPVLAAVVKGTRFTVSANPMGAAVHVLEGAVEVSAFASQQTGMVTPGQTARLDSSPGSRLEIDGNDAPAGKASDSFERTLDMEESEAANAPLSVPAEIKQADAGVALNPAEAPTVSLDIEATEVSVTEDDAASDSGQQLAERQEDAVDSGPRVIRVALGNTDINLRQVTRGLVRNAVIERESGVGEGRDDDEPALEEAEDSEEPSSTESSENTFVSIIETDEDEASIGSVEVEAATGLGTEMLAVGSDFSVDTGNAAADATTGLGELPAGLDNVAGLPSGLGEDSSPTGIGDSGDITDTVTDIVSDIDDDIDDVRDDLDDVLDDLDDVRDDLDDVPDVPETDGEMDDD